MEIETAHGCSRGVGCSFCTEPLKNKFEFRECADVIAEVKALYSHGARHFRIGKQSCFYSYPHACELLKGIREACPDILTLHIDNVDPMMVCTPRGDKITQDIVKYCTEGNVAAFGVESFDPEVIQQNNLNAQPEKVLEAVRVINKYGAELGPNGMPKYLPGINILFGLAGETKKTHEHNMKWLGEIIAENMVRRINIRQVDVFPGTPLYDMGGVKFLAKNKKYYYRWRADIREKIDTPNLARVAPIGNTLKKVYTEIYDGKMTFGRQIGTYPLIVGIPGRLPLRKYVDVQVTAHMLRSVTGIAICDPYDAK